ncbi:HAD family hydrolase [Intestinibacter bartlettii]|uniref:HAD-IA family hydrolase n=1 Tax=Intestinibacter bartlettii TaxID=261299 RepID=A0ABS6DXE2_9FIRM|nr:HAD-IA family hydrolase [Intestinibacter bartlettii]MBU5336520.1 HAD-IA family hydrolase [Intestinibacter bartlettii]
MKNYDAYIFDFDYTLADATNPVVDSFTYALEKMNLEKSSRQDIINTIGIPIGKSYTILTGDDSEEGIALFKKYQKEKSDEITVPNTVFIGHAKEVLQTLKNRGKKVGIVSSRWGQRINDIFENLNSRELIDFIIGTEHVENYKPNPEGLFKMIDMMDAKNPLYIGDSYIDAEAAQNAKVDFVGVTTGTTPREKLESYPHVAVLDDLKDLLDI